METVNTEALETVTARFFKGLGDPVRLRIIDFLRNGEKSAGQIVDHLGLPQNAVSTHLGCLKWCGYVANRKEGRFVWYSLKDERVLEIIRGARDLLLGSEVYLMTCDVIEQTDENLANVTAWRKLGSRGPSRTG